MDNLRKFNTEADYSAATLNYPAVSWVVSGDIVHFDKEAPTQTFSGLTVHYNITDISQPTKLFKGGGGSGSGSGSGSGGVLPSAMIIDGTAVEVANTYQFSTTGEHIVNYSFADNQIPKNFVFNTYGLVTKAVIGDSITSIGVQAFSYCNSLTSCTIGSGVTSIGEGAFGNCTSLTNCTIGNSVTSIGWSNFSNCTSLTSITIPSGVTSIGGYAFNGCTSLTSIDIPDSVTSINGNAFNGCTSLTSCTIGSGVTSIDTNTFGSCTSLTSITIPSGVTSIGGYAFYGCSGLTSIVSNATTAPTISSSTFQNVKTGGTLTVPSGSSGYDVWMQNADYYLGLYEWTKVEQ